MVFLCGDPGGEVAGDSAGVAGAEAARRREYSVPPTAMAVPPPMGSVMRVMLMPDAERVGREVAGDKHQGGHSIWRKTNY